MVRFLDGTRAIMSFTKDLQFMGFFSLCLWGYFAKCGQSLLSANETKHIHRSVFLFKGPHDEAGIKFWNMSTHFCLPLSKKPSFKVV